ncbi:hypothetical protein [Streptomyces phytophilus]|uniref:hypothetical protein n=1 Tax=Streptomyces phytophilus TaxID=722715 RepID=UPI0015F009D9|nr:hypothetical protein [Streptomyces phytophilus]
MAAEGASDRTETPAARRQGDDLPGAQAIVARLATTHTQLRHLHTPGSAEDMLAQLVVMASRRLDDVHKQLTTLAERTADDLHRVAEGRMQINSLGILQNSALALDILAARRADAIEHLKDLIHTYQHATTPQHRRLQNRTGPSRDAAPTAPSAAFARRP